MPLIRQESERMSATHPTFEVCGGIAVCERCRMSLTVRDALYHNTCNPALENEVAPPSR